jgi:hypothetical protein
MLVTKQSAITGIIRTLDLDITEDQYKAWESGTMIHLAFPNLTADQREFLLTGATDDDWNSMYASV